MNILKYKRINGVRHIIEEMMTIIMTNEGIPRVDWLVVEEESQSCLFV